MLDQETRARLQDTYGPFGEWESPDGAVVVVKKPSSSAYRAFIAKVAKDNANKETAIRDLVRECSVYPEKAPGVPDGDKVDAIFDEWPAAPLALSAAVTELAGGGSEARIRKN